MALRDQPYLPLYVDDFISDEKLRMCSAESTGVYIMLMCLMHKSDEYGVISLTKRDKGSGDQVKNFATILLRQLPYDFATIEHSLDELLERKVLMISGDKLYQKRMVKDAQTSKKRAISGSKGGKQKASNLSSKNLANSLANDLANTVIVNEDVIHLSSSDKSTGDTGVQGEKNQRELSKVMTLYLNRINPAPSGFCIDLLKSYTEDMGADVVCRAINMAIDKKADWNYIKAILQNWAKQKVKCIGDVDRLVEKAGGWKKKEASNDGGFHYDPGPMEGSL